MLDARIEDRPDFAVGEIEAALLKQTGIRRAAVLALCDAAQGNQLAAVVVTDHPAMDMIELSRAFSEHLPRALVPTLLHAVDAMPLSANGKVDRAAIETMLVGLRSHETLSQRAPVFETEARLCAIWCDLLSR